MIGPPPRSPLFPYTTLSRSQFSRVGAGEHGGPRPIGADPDEEGQLAGLGVDRDGGVAEAVAAGAGRAGGDIRSLSRSWLDRKSTRLNSSHANISYAVFCLKK